MLFQFIKHTMQNIIFLLKSSNNNSWGDSNASGEIFYACFCKYLPIFEYLMNASLKVSFSASLQFKFLLAA